MVFQTVYDDKHTVREKVTVQLVALVGLFVKFPHRPVTFQGQSGTFNLQVFESGIFITDRP